MTDVLDSRMRSTLSDDEVWPSPVVGPDTSSWLSEREIRFVGSGSVGGRTLDLPSQRQSSTRRRAADLLEPLLWLNDGWDGHGALAPTTRALKMAGGFLRSLQEPAPFPDVMASVTGGVILEWESIEVDLVIEIQAAGGALVFLRRGDAEEEGPLAVHQQAAGEALAALSYGAH